MRELFSLVVYLLAACGGPGPAGSDLVVSGAVHATFRVDSYVHLSQTVPDGTQGQHDLVRADCTLAPRHPELRGCAFTVQALDAGISLLVGWSGTSVSAGSYSEANTAANMICYVTPDGSKRWEMHSGDAAHPSNSYGAFSLQLKSVQIFRSDDLTATYDVHGVLRVSCLPGAQSGNAAAGTLDIDFTF
jgi:hypothetical protein